MFRHRSTDHLPTSELTASERELAYRTPGRRTRSVRQPRHRVTAAAALSALALFAAACGSDTTGVDTAAQATTQTDGGDPDSTANYGEEVAATAVPEQPEAIEDPDAAADPDAVNASSSNEVVAPNSSAWARNAGALPPEQRNGIYGEAPAMTIDTASAYLATIATEKGEMEFELFAADAPITVNNFVNLATDGFYNGVTFHRVIDTFMAQGGDPTGMGSGGPGYQFVNEYTPGIEFGDRGILAMANAGSDTNGSQFFITFDDAFLPASDYTVFGRLTAGDDTLSSIRMRDPGSDPAPGDLITGVTIRKIG